MKKSILIALVVGLVAASMTGTSAQAKKAKWVQSELKFFLHWDDDGADGCDGMVHMSLEDTPGDTSCEFVLNGLNEVLIASGQEPLSRDWPASAGVPFVLDATKPIIVEMVINGAAGAQAGYDIVLSGASGSSTKELAVGTTETTTGPILATGPATVKFEATPDKSLNRKKFTSLNLNTIARGLHAITYVEMEDPPSFVTVPVWIKK